jgi:hypothetical protein
MTKFPDTSGMTTEERTKTIGEWFQDPLNKRSYTAVENTVGKLTNYFEPHGFMLDDFHLLVSMVSEELHKLKD